MYTFRCIILVGLVWAEIFSNSILVICALLFHSVKNLYAFLCGIEHASFSLWIIFHIADV